MSEHSMVSAKASVMIYSDVEKKWLPNGSSAGISKVSIYHHAINNTFRVVGRKLQDMEVVVNCSIFKTLKYNQATPTFHQWRDSRQVYGLNFANKEDADNFAQAMYSALDSLNAASAPTSSMPPASSQIIVSHDQHQVFNSGGSITTNGQERTKNDPWTPNDGHQHALSMDNLSQPNEIGRLSNRDSVNSCDIRGSQTISAAPPSPQAPPPAPPAPPLALAKSPPPAPSISNAPTPPPAPPCPAPPISSAPPPPPPPPVPPVSAANAGGLAAALQSAQLRKVNKVNEVKDKEDSAPIHPAPLGRSASCVAAVPISGDIMSEMARRLRERRAKTEGLGSELDGGSKIPSSINGMKGIGNGNGVDSPRVDRSKRFQSLTGQEAFSSSYPSAACSSSRPATVTDLDIWKQEILTEVRKEIQTVKFAIIEAIRCELTKR